MVAATYVSDLVEIFLFEVTTGVAAFNITGSGGASLGASGDYAVEGSNAVDKQISNSEKGFMFQDSSPFTIGADDHLYIWINLAVYGLAATRDDRGICVCVGDDTTNFVQYHMNGSDTLPRGGAKPYAVRFNNVPLTNRRTVTGTPGTTPDNLGCTASVTATAKFSNLGADAARVGNGYDILNGTGGDPEANFAGIASDDEGTAEGIFQTADGGYSLQGKLRIGSSGTECEFLDLNTNVFLVAALEGHTLRDFTEILLEHVDSILTLTNVNIIALGTYNRGRLEMITEAATIAAVNVGFIGFGETFLGTGATFTGCRWIGCDQVVAKGATLTDSTISGFEDLRLVDAQDETSYNNSPTTEGTFVGGSGYVAAETIELDDGSIITIDLVSTGEVTEFTVDSSTGNKVADGDTLVQVDTSGTGTGFTLSPEEDNIDDRASLLWNTADDPNGEMDGMSYTKGAEPTHAIEFGTTSPLTMTLTDVDFFGYGSTGDKDAAVWFRRISGTINLTITGGTTPSFKTDGAAINIISGSVTVQVTATESDGTPVENSRVVLVAADNSGPFPFEESVTISNSGTTATVTHTGHNMATNDKTEINGANHWQNNGVFQITVNDANEYEYTLPSDPGGSPTGSITSTFVALEGLTNASGIVTTSRVYSSSQPITGRSRKSSASPFFKTAEINDTIDNAEGLSVTAVMISDE